MPENEFIPEHAPTSGGPSGAVARRVGEAAFTPEACGCISEMNERLAEHNTVLTVPMLGPARAILSTYQRETGRGKKKAAYVFANYCPFCGIKYAKVEA